MQEEARKEMTSGDSEERFDTYNEYYKLVDVVQKAALDELKVRSIDRRNMQDAKIRQLIYLCITLCAAICTVITLTPFWSGKGAILSAAQPWHLFMLCVAFILSAGGFIYGVWSLIGENGGIVPIEGEYAQILRDGYGPDNSGKAYEATIDWLTRIDESLDIYADLIGSKAKKIRTLNKIVLGAAGCAAVAAVALFSTTLLENYVKQQAEALCAEAAALESSDKPVKKSSTKLPE